MAMSADGIIAKNSNHFVNWTEPADKKFFVEITRKAGVVVMGSKTFDTIGKALPGRLNVIMTRNKERISNEDNLEFSSKSPSELLSDLKQRGYSEVSVIGGAVINSLFLRDNLVDNIHLTVCPLLFGQGLTMFAEDHAVKLKLQETKVIGEESVLITYQVVK